MYKICGSLLGGGGLKNKMKYLHKYQNGRSNKTHTYILLRNLGQQICFSNLILTGKERLFQRGKNVLSLVLNTMI